MTINVWWSSLADNQHCLTSGGCFSVRVEMNSRSAFYEILRRCTFALEHSDGVFHAWSSRAVTKCSLGALLHWRAVLVHSMELQSGLLRNAFLMRSRIVAIVPCIPLDSLGLLVRV